MTFVEFVRDLPQHLGPEQVRWRTLMQGRGGGTAFHPLLPLPLALSRVGPRSTAPLSPWLQPSPAW